MKKFIIINGAMGVGKTATGKKVCDILGRSAFIDGDWCLDIHPFIGNRETKDMAINNILYMSKNYYNCSECDSVVLSWIMSINTVKKINSGLSDIDFQIYNFVLSCDKESLTDRWKKDNINDWRNDENLNNSIKSLDDFNNRTECIMINTSDLSVEMAAKKIIEKLI